MKAGFGIIALIIALRLGGAWLLPLVTDEAYYHAWSSILDWGYFDHPPMVAWLASLGSWADGPGGQRLGAWALGLGSWLIAARLVRLHAPESARLPTLLLLMGNLFIAAAGFLVTPDAGLCFFWILALHEATLALRGADQRWLSAGLATGLGILSKYMMVVLGPVFLWALCRQPGALKRPWPYLGALVCLLTISPHLAWSAKHDWVSLRFQLGHGLGGNHAGAEMAASDRVPVPKPAKVFSPEWQLAQAFIEPGDIGTPKAVKSAWRQLVERQSNFLGAVLGVWGLGLIALCRRRRESEPKIKPESLIVAATVVPLVVFAAVSCWQRIEGNWPAPYVIGAALLLGPRVRRDKTFYALLVANSVLLTAVCILGPQPPAWLAGKAKRILQETHGYPKLAAALASQEKPLYTETYQLQAMLALHGLADLHQYPGLSRPSEFSRRAAWQLKDMATVPAFSIVQTGAMPAFLEGFRAVTLSEWRDCAGRLQMRELNALGQLPEGCLQPIHRWFQVQYVRSAKH